MKKVIVIVLSIIFIFGMVCLIPFVRSSDGKSDTIRVLTYIRAHNAVSSHFDTSHMEQATDIVMFEIASFDENGEVVKDERYDTCMEHVKPFMKADKSQKLYVNLYGPRKDAGGNHYSQEELCSKHNEAFVSGNLEENIKNFLIENDFAGVFFDYEFPQSDEDWQIFNAFLVSLDATLGDDLEIGTAMSYWDSKYSDESKEKVDIFALMEYDNFDNDNHHSSVADAKRHVKNLINEQGFDKTKLLLGLPFYGRPTTHEELWYDYATYYQDLDSEGFYVDSEDTGLTFSFNTYQMIYDKTAYAISEGLAGVMVWHYACDLPASNEKSLFNAITKCISDSLKRSPKLLNFDLKFANCKSPAAFRMI